MTKHSPEIIQLRKDIEESIERKLHTPNDFDYLVMEIWQRIHEVISPTTVKRLWGYIDGAETIRLSTLDILAKFLWFKDFEAYLTDLRNRQGIESELFLSGGILAHDMQVGECIRVEWLPNRKCVFEYLGDARWRVVQAEYAKIKKGDTFVCSFFLKNHPMYLEELVQDGQPPVSYIAGKRNGLTCVEKCLPTQSR